MPKKKDTAQQVQEQITRSLTNIGRVRTRGPSGIDFTDIKDPVVPNLSDVTYKSRSFTSTQGRCVHYSPVVSGFGERENDSGWCVLVSGGDLGWAPDTIEGDAAWINWLRESPPGTIVGCDDGKFSTDLGAASTCSGFNYQRFYIPSLNDFRKTSEQVRIYDTPTQYGVFTESLMGSGYTAVHSFEAFKSQNGPVKIGVKSPDSFGIYASGVLKYSSGRFAGNISQDVHLTMPSGHWVRFDFVHYVPEGNVGRLTIDGDFTRQLDGWRAPNFPQAVEAWYGTFAKQDPGEGPARWSYVWAQIGIPPPPINVLGEFDLESVELDWKAPDVFDGYRRIIIPVPLRASVVSGMFRVPGAELINVRARGVNFLGDPGPWHTVSGLDSAAANVKGNIFPDDPNLYGFDLAKGLGRFEFNVHPSHKSDEEWQDFILISGGTQSDTMATSTLNQNATIGDRTIVLTGSIPFSSSGHMISLGTSATGNAYEDQGESHLIESMSDGVTVNLVTPVITARSTSNPVQVHQVAKIVSATEFGINMDNKEDWFFNVTGRTFNGGISNMASGYLQWPGGAVDITVVDGLIGAEVPPEIGANHIRNGSFEVRPYPGFAPDTPVRLAPLRMWFAPSGSTTFLSGPFIERSRSRDGLQNLQLGLGSDVIQGNPSVWLGHHAGIWQDITTLNWGGTYTAKVYGYNERTQAGDYKASGVLGLYYEIWETDVDQVMGGDYRYGQLPANNTNFLTSGSSRAYFDAQDGYSEVEYYSEFLEAEVSVTGGSEDKVPFVRFCLFYDPDVININWEGSSFGAGTYVGVEPIHIDDVSLSRLGRSENPFDDFLDQPRVHWESFRTNIDSRSSGGHHLDVDDEYGFVEVERRANPKPDFNIDPSSLESETISGHKDYSTLIRHIPNAASIVGSPGHIIANSLWLAGGTIVVPSGRGLVFDIKPVRTFEFQTDTEVLLGGIYPVGYIFPSGNHQYGNVSHWFDPGKDAVVQIADVNYTTDSYISRTSLNPVVAKWGDLKINSMYLECFTAIIDPAGARHDAYWHVAKVNIYETKEPFITSGVNTTGGNNVGYNPFGGIVKL
jgi:hypothetical protein